MRKRARFGFVVAVGPPSCEGENGPPAFGPCVCLVFWLINDKDVLYMLTLTIFNK